MSKGLSFAPKSKSSEFDTKIDLFRFYRNLHLKVWYKLNPSLRLKCHRSNRYIFKPKSVCCPLDQNATLNAFLKKVNFDVEQLFAEKNRTSYQSNLSKKENEATSMKKWENSHKKSWQRRCNCNLGENKYIAEANRTENMIRGLHFTLQIALN